MIKTTIIVEDDYGPEGCFVLVRRKSLHAHSKYPVDKQVRVLAEEVINDLARAGAHAISRERQERS